VPDESLDEAAGGPANEMERFRPTSGRIAGVLSVLLAAAIVAVSVVRPGDVVAPVTAGAAFGGVLAWAALLRPRVSASAETLHLTNMLETVEIPLAAVDELVVRQVLVVRAGERTFRSPALGRKLRKVLGVGRPRSLFLPGLGQDAADELGDAGDLTQHPTVVDYADHVESRLRVLVEEARHRRGVRRYSDEALALAGGVRRRPAWPEVAALALTGAVFVLTLVL
jgi:hypothetical protein